MLSKWNGCRPGAALLLVLGLNLNIIAQVKQPGSATGQITVGKDLHHDLSLPLRGTAPLPPLHHRARIAAIGGLSSHRGEAAATESMLPMPELVNGVTGAATTLGVFNIAGVGNFFTGPGGTFTPTASPSDATGAVGTTQYMQWVDDSFAVFSKASGGVEYGPAAGNTIWSGFGGACQTDNAGQPTVNFDKLAKRWVVSQYAVTSGQPFLQCVAVSQTDDATGSWYRYSFGFGAVNGAYQHRDAKLGVWPDGYYMSFNLYNGTTYVGPRLCALQRTNMLIGAGANIQCTELSADYFNPIVSDLDSSTPPPAGAPAYFAADDPFFYAVDFWKFHVDWNDSQNSTLGLPVQQAESFYNAACGTFGTAVCVLQPNGVALDSHGNHILGRMPYRNYGDHQSMLMAESVENPTTIRFYEARISASGDISVYQQGNVQANMPAFRFLPSMAADKVGNIAAAYNLSNLQVSPGQYVSTWAPGDPAGTLGNETLLNPGNGSETTSAWDGRASLTVDPIDDCTFYYTEQYEPMTGTNNWSTQIESFTLAGCNAVMFQSVPAGLKISVKESGGAGIANTAATPYSENLPAGAKVAIEALTPQAGPTGTQYVFSSWSDGGAQGHYVTIPAVAPTYIATYNTQYTLSSTVSPVGGGTVSPATSWVNAGAVIGLVATPAAGYGFGSWTGNVANSGSAATTITVSGPQSVRANFVPLPTTVNAVLTAQSGPANGRVWTFSLTNAGPGVANSVAVNAFALTQSAGVACKPVLLTKLPLSAGNIAPGSSVGVAVSINFTGCGSDALFALTLGNTENGGASHSTATLTNLAQ
jgi:hypothetical protein